MKKSDPGDLVTREVELIEEGLALQSQGLELLLAEMSAVAGLMAGAAAQGSASEASSEAETEAGFDNMPV